MPTTRRRSASTHVAKRTANASRETQRDISAFARVTKSRLSATSKGEDYPVESPIDESTSELRKRKRSTLAQPPSVLVSPAKRQKTSASQPSIVTPKKPLQNPQGLPTPDHTPSRALYHDRSVLITPTKRNTLPTTTCASPPATPSSLSVNPSALDDSAVELPFELYDLIDLHIAFLKSLSLHFAHHGTASPVDIRNLLPSVSKTWGRRTVTLDDIKRTLGILQLSSNAAEDEPGPRTVAYAEKSPELHLYDYGNGRICLEMATSTAAHAAFARPINEGKLNSLFESNLRNLWSNFQAPSTTSKTHADNTTTFITRLPQAQTPPHPSTKSSKSTTRTLLGQTRLTDLMSFSRQNKPTTSAPATNTSTHSNEPAPLKSRASSLLARLNAKFAASQLQSTPETETSAASKAVHKAALQRIPEVVSILSLLRGSASASTPATAEQGSDASMRASTRQTYSLPALMQTVQASTRGVMGAEEVQRCLDILADDSGVAGGVAGQGFVRIVRIGGKGSSGTVVGVVVDVGRRVPLAVVKERVVALLADEDHMGFG